MPDRNEAALQFLLTRRSRPAKTLKEPVPSRAELAPILEAAMRTPDHGKLEPWRFIVLEKGAMSRLANLAETRAAALGLDSNATFKGKDQYAKGNLAVVVVESLQENEKIPHIEQTYSAGAVCLALVNAALASGWGANWLSGWTSHDREFVKVGFGLDENERVAGIIHIGTEGFEPPERPRPNPEEKITWQSE